MKLLKLGKTVELGYQMQSKMTTGTTPAIMEHQRTYLLLSWNTIRRHSTNKFVKLKRRLENLEFLQQILLFRCKSLRRRLDTIDLGTLILSPEPIVDNVFQKTCLYFSDLNCNCWKITEYWKSSRALEAMLVKEGQMYSSARSTIIGVVIKEQDWCQRITYKYVQTAIKNIIASKLDSKTE